MNGGSAVLASCIIRSCSSDSVPNVLRYESVVKPPVSEALCSFFTFGCAAPPLLCGLFGSCGERGLLSFCRAWASHCGGFPSCRAQSLGHTGFSSCGSQALEDRLNS